MNINQVRTDDKDVVVSKEITEVAGAKQKLRTLIKKLTKQKNSLEVKGFFILL